MLSFRAGEPPAPGICRCADDAPRGCCRGRAQCETKVHSACRHPAVRETSEEQHTCSHSPSRGERTQRAYEEQTRIVVNSPPSHPTEPSASDTNPLATWSPPSISAVGLNVEMSSRAPVTKPQSHPQHPHRTTGPYTAGVPVFGRGSGRRAVFLRVVKTISKHTFKTRFRCDDSRTTGTAAG